MNQEKNVFTGKVTLALENLNDAEDLTPQLQSKSIKRTRGNTAEIEGLSDYDKAITSIDPICRIDETAPQKKRKPGVIDDLCESLEKQIGTTGVPDSDYTDNRSWSDSISRSASRSGSLIRK